MSVVRKQKTQLKMGKGFEQTLHQSKHTDVQ